MTRLFLLLIFLYPTGYSKAQTADSLLSQINTVEQAAEFLKKNPKTKAGIITIRSSHDTSGILLPLFDRNTGFSFKIGDHSYKILQVDSALSFRVNYIYLSGEQLTRPEIDSLRRLIITSYKKGTSFFDLAMQYNMDGNITGDTGWFTEGMMVKEFETAVRGHKKGEIFTVDTPGYNWYHVVLKSHENRYIKTLTLLQLKLDR